MADRMSIDGPVQIESDGKERVALALLDKIALEENETQDRDYYLTLYSECLWVVRGYEPKKYSART